MGENKSLLVACDPIHATGFPDSSSTEDSLKM